MQIDVEDLMLAKCRQLIEEKLGWGSSDIWTNHDFELLGEKIETETKVNLSVATLKRIWGKIKYTSKPTITTLDTLVQFIGYENWRVFKIRHNEEGSPKPLNGNGHARDSGIVTDSVQTPSFKQSFRFMVVPVVVALLSAVVILFIFYTNRHDNSPSADSHLEGQRYSFSSKKVVSEGVPNSVIFDYDASAASTQDTIFIQQSWDRRFREQVTKNNHNKTSIYYYPGFFQAKLVVNSRIMKEHNIYIRTNGWLPLIEQQSVPVYFSEADAINNGVMTLAVDKIVANGVAMQPEPPWVAFHNARTFNDLMSDNFIFETEVKNDYKAGGGVCQLTEIHIRLEGGMIMIPLSIKGCVSNLNLFDRDGRKPDPSPLGCDFSDWVNVRVEVKNKVGQLFINHNKAFDLNLDIPPVKIVGLLYRFQGTGSINSVKLATIHDHVVYEENF